MNSITISQIQTNDLLFYDPDFAAECYQFCKVRDIDCLPTLMATTIYYQREENGEGFAQKEITEERRVEAAIDIFTPVLLNQFRASKLLFVYAHAELTGVVHFSDYNQPLVNTYLYSMLFEFEKKLRQLLNLCNLAKGDIDSYLKRRPKSTAEKSSPFQALYLKELLDLVEYKSIIPFDQQTNERHEINALRNMVMHAHELVDMQDRSTDDFIFDFASFERFFNRVQILKHNLRRVQNKVKLLQK